MGTEDIKRDLKGLAERGIEPAPRGLVERIKSHIPQRLVLHRWDTVSIIVDFRISRIGAAAAIILALVVAGGVFGGREGIGASVLRDSRLFLQYKLRGESVSSSLAPEDVMRLRDGLLAQGREVVCYSENPTAADKFSILMYWKLSGDDYCVVMGDLSTRTVSAKALIRLQTYMLQKRSQ